MVLFCARKYQNKHCLSVKQTVTFDPESLSSSSSALLCSGASWIWMAGGGRGEWCTGTAPFRWSYRSTDIVSDKLCVILICELSVYRPNIQLCRVLVNSQN